MSEKFRIEVSDFGFIGGTHYYGNIQIPASRMGNGWYRVELDHGKEGDTFRTIKFWTIADVIKAAKEWFLKDPRVKPGDKLVISRDLWDIRNEPLEPKRMVVQAKIQLHIPCPSCMKGGWRVDHLSIGIGTTWACSNCHTEANIKRISDDEFETVPTERKETPVTVTLQSITEPKIILKLNTWKYSHDQDSSQEDYESHQQYFYDEHTCPTNWTREIVEIIFQGDHDPHGVFEFVSVVDGHLVDDPYGGAMIPGKEIRA